MKSSARLSLLILAGFAAMIGYGCGPLPWAQPVPVDSMDYRQTAEQLALWPARREGQPAMRKLGVVLDVKGWSAEGTGTLEWYGPRDFRIMLRQRAGYLLLDASRNWAGVRVFERAPQLGGALVQTIVNDLSRALDPPPNLEGLAAQKDRMVLQRVGADGRDVWLFDRASGRLLAAELGSGHAGTVYVKYSSFSEGGGPAQLSLRDAGMRYEMELTLGIDG